MEAVKSAALNAVHENNEIMTRYHIRADHVLNTVAQDNSAIPAATTSTAAEVK